MNLSFAEGLFKESPEIIRDNKVYKKDADKGYGRDSGRQIPQY
jgi:hypothetical protein